MFSRPHFNVKALKIDQNFLFIYLIEKRGTNLRIDLSGFVILQCSTLEKVKGQGKPARRDYLIFLIGKCYVTFLDEYSYQLTQI